MDEPMGKDTEASFRLVPPYKQISSTEFKGEKNFTDH